MRVDEALALALALGTVRVVPSSMYPFLRKSAYHWLTSYPTDLMFLVGGAFMDPLTFGRLPYERQPTYV